MPGENIQDWSTTAINNGSADTAINWQEGMPRADVNNSARSMMAAIAKYRDLMNGSIVTGGTANAQTFMSGLSYVSIPTGLRVLLKIGVTNTGPATLNMDLLGAVAIKNQLGQDLAGGDLTLGSYAEFRYDGTSWVLISGASAFASGTLMLFVQTAAPVGWTKQTTHDDKALRIVSGTASTGGTAVFSTVFGRTAVDGYTLTIAEMPGHSHSVNCYQAAGQFNGAGYLATNASGASPGDIMAFSPSFINPFPIASAGGGGSHVHTVDLRVQYVDCIIAAKD
jgi:hypothetical protein